MILPPAAVSVSLSCAVMGLTTGESPAMIPTLLAEAGYASLSSQEK